MLAVLFCGVSYHTLAIVCLKHFCYFNLMKLQATLIQKPNKIWGRMKKKNFRREEFFSIWHIDVDLVTCKWWCTKKAHLKGISLQKRARMHHCAGNHDLVYVLVLQFLNTCSMKKMKQDGGKQDKLSQCTAGPDFCSKIVNKSMITLQ